MFAYEGLQPMTKKLLNSTFLCFRYSVCYAARSDFNFRDGGQENQNTTRKEKTNEQSQKLQA